LTLFACFLFFYSCCHSGISDGAGTIILASEEAVKEKNLKPLARLVGWSVAGVDPKIMGTLL
jgi:acetyl-CoA acetyltransferase